MPVEFDTKKAVRGRNLIHSTSRYRDSNNDMGSVLLDLLHYAKLGGLKFEEELDWARKAFDEDITILQDYERRVEALCQPRRDRE